MTHLKSSYFSIIHGNEDPIAAAILNAAPVGQLHIISDSNVAPLYAQTLAKKLENKNSKVTITIFEAGEKSKNLATISSLWKTLLRKNINRKDTIVAVGGGVVGDMAGFVASTLLRGINIIQVPTTVLAMVDASIGGKTGFNENGKNLIGSFHPPVKIIAWIDSLKSLSDRQFRSGLAEIVKTALLSGEKAMTFLEQNAQKLLKRDKNTLKQAILIAAEYKLRIVKQDLLEQGKRAWLNLGHTFAHAIEHAQNYTQWTHGEAVSAGLVLAAQFACDVKILDSKTLERIKKLLFALHLPIKPPTLSRLAWLRPIRNDKKRLLQQQRLILLTKIGEPIIYTVEDSTFESWIVNSTQTLNSAQ